MNRKLSVKNQAVSPSATLAITAKAKKIMAEGIDVINFSAGEPDFRTPENIRATAIDMIENGPIGYTSAAGLPELKEAICSKLRTDNGLEYKPENIIVSNGAKQSLYNAMQAICNAGDEVILQNPYWVSYPEIIKLADAVPVFVNTTEDDGFKYKKESLLSAITPKTKAIIINSPNNPTGAVYSEDELAEIARIAVAYSIYVISDEIYEKLIYRGKHTSIASLGNEIKDLTIVVNGLSKCCAMTGWRIGYAAANTEITTIMTNIQSHSTSNPNTIAQYASIEALRGDQSKIELMRKAFLQRRDVMTAKINSIEGLSCTVPQGAFYVMVNISQIIGKRLNGYKICNSNDFAEYLLDVARVAVIPGSAFGREGYIRLSYATSLDKITEGVGRIENALG